VFFCFGAEFKGFSLNRAVFVVELVELCGKILVFSLELGVGRILVWKSGKTIVIFLELSVGGSKLRDFLSELLVLVESFSEEFLDEREVWEELLLGVVEVACFEGFNPVVE
jgi:hypothetical protein